MDNQYKKASSGGLREQFLKGLFKIKLLLIIYCNPVLCSINFIYSILEIPLM